MRSLRWGSWWGFWATGSAARGWLGGLVGLLALIVAAGLAVAFAPYSVQQGMVLLFFDPARTWAAVGASVLGALVVCGAVQAASWLILRRICVK